jgi:hypothetical protein
MPVGQAKEMPPRDAVEALNKLLFGKRLAHFHVGHQFSLYFGNYMGGPDRPAPPVEVVCVCSDFWINDKRKWAEMVAGVPSSITEPAVPIKAYELARLCWIADTEVVRVTKDATQIILTLKNGETISIPDFGEDEFAFLLSDDTSETRSSFSVCCVDGDFYARGIEFLSNSSWSTP